MRGKLSTRIWLIAGFLFAGLLLLVRENLTRDVGDLLGNFKISADNFFYYLTPKRSLPVTTTEKEVLLKTTFGESFISFSLQDWQEFWQIIYGVYEVDPPDSPRLPRRARQLTIPEIQERLAKIYPDFFGNFNQEYWNEFWGILKIRQ